MGLSVVKLRYLVPEYFINENILWIKPVTEQRYISTVWSADAVWKED